MIVRTCLSVHIECPVEDRESVSYGRVVHATLVESLLGKLFFLCYLVYETEERGGRDMKF